MKRIFGLMIGMSAVFGSGAALVKATEPAAIPTERKFTFTYKVTVDSPPEGQGPVEVYVPLAKSDEHQDVLARNVTASIPGTEEQESKFGNQYWHGHLEKSDGKPVTVEVLYTVNRKLFQKNLSEGHNNTAYSAEEKKATAEYLKSDSLVPVSGQLIDKVRKDIKKAGSDPLSRARAIYDYVVDHMEYKKVGTGWGNGSTEWACNQKYGNCTDFHALFISLARSEGIPAKFEIGFSIPMDKPEGDIAGYHCWAEFFLPKIGWTPVDASEAKKNPSLRETLFGTYPADRFQVSAGRDLQIGKGGTLNFFIYPYVEFNGARYDKVQTAFKFKAVS